MKKLLTIVAALIIAMSCVSFIACGNDITGVYKIYSVTRGDKTYNIGDEYEGEILFSGSITFTLNEDGTFITYHMGDKAEGAWEKGKNGNLLLVINGEDSESAGTTITVDGDILTFISNDTTLIFKKSYDQEINIEGTYKFKSLTYRDTTINVGDTREGVTIEADAMIITLSNDGTVYEKENFGEEIERTGTWREVYNGYLLDMRGLDVVAKIEGNIMTIDDDGVIFVLEKQQ